MFQDFKLSAAGAKRGVRSVSSRRAESSPIQMQANTCNWNTCLFKTGQDNTSLRWFANPLFEANRGSWVSPEETDNGKHWFISGNNGNYPLLGLSTHWQLGLTLVITVAEWSCPQKATPPLDHDGNDDDEDGDDLSMKITMVMVIMAEKDVMGYGWLLVFYILAQWHIGTFAQWVKSTLSLEGHQYHQWPFVNLNNHQYTHFNKGHHFWDRL